MSLLRPSNSLINLWKPLRLLFPVMLLGGCGPSGPTTVPMSGTVTINGTPLTIGVVRFNPVDPEVGRPAEGAIDAEGKFTISTFKSGDGAIPGDYNITIISMLEDADTQQKDQGLGISGKSAIPKKYNDPETSGLSETVVLGQPRNDVELVLEE